MRQISIGSMLAVTGKISNSIMKKIFKSVRKRKEVPHKNYLNFGNVI